MNCRKVPGGDIPWVHTGDSPLKNIAVSLIRYLEDVLPVADEIEDGRTGFLIERALDEARSRQV
jgi:hypothetical protein